MNEIAVNDITPWLELRRRTEVKETDRLYIEIQERATGHGWEVDRPRPARVVLMKTSFEVRVEADLSGGIIGTLIYFFGDGRHFAVAVDDERRRESPLGMSEILDRWLAGGVPDVWHGRVLS